MKRKTTQAETLPGIPAQQADPAKITPPAAPANLPQKVQRAPPAPPENMLAVIARAASNPKVDVAKMQALLQMQKEIVAEESRREFYADMIELQADLPAIRKDGKIEIQAKDSSGRRGGVVIQSTPYATFDNIMRVIKPILRKHGFVLTYATEPVGERLLVIGKLNHRGGHQERTSFPLPADAGGSKSVVQSWGSSMSYGKRYTTIALVNLQSEAPDDADRDGHPNAPKDVTPTRDAPSGLTEAQADTMREAIEACTIGIVEFCKHYAIGKVSDLPPERFHEAIKACQAYGEKVSAKKSSARR